MKEAKVCPEWLLRLSRPIGVSMLLMSDMLNDNLIEGEGELVHLNEHGRVVADLIGHVVAQRLRKRYRWIHSRDVESVIRLRTFVFMKDTPRKEYDVFKFNRPQDGFDLCDMVKIMDTYKMLAAGFGGITPYPSEGKGYAVQVQVRLLGNMNKGMAYSTDSLLFRNSIEPVIDSKSSAIDKFQAITKTHKKVSK